MSAIASIVNNTSSPKGKQASAPGPSQSSTNGASINTTQSGSENTKSNPAASSASADDIKYKRKYKDLKKRIRDIEEDNDILNIKLSRARKNIHRLRVERSFLFDRLDQSEQATHPSTSSSSTSDSDTDEERTNDRAGDGLSKGRRGHRHSHGLDRLKRFRHSYSSLHHHPSSSHSTYGQRHARSKTPPSRGSSIVAHHAQGTNEPASASLSPSSSTIGGTVTSPTNATTAAATAATTGTAAGKRATKKRRKDPLAPKRPSNAFFIFSQQHRQQAREEKKEGNQSELTKFLGQQWKSMPSTEKKIYSELAVQDRQRYLEEMMLYEHEHGFGSATQNGSSQKQRKKTPGKVGRPSKYPKENNINTSVNNVININGNENSNSNGNDNSNGHNGTNVMHSNNSSSSIDNSNGHSAAKKMEINAMINGDTEGEDMMTSHDEDDNRMLEDGASDEGREHDDEEDDEEEDEEDVDHDQEDDEEEVEEESQSRQSMENHTAHIRNPVIGYVHTSNSNNSHHHGHDEDVNMDLVDRTHDHVQETGLLASA